MNMAAEQAQGVIVFFSYVKRDKMLRDRLEEHLSNLKYKGLVQTWHDRDILAGSDWLEQIDISLHNSQIILLLISSTFMASDYCYGKEMQQALQLHAQKKATVIPILLRPVLYTDAPFARLSMLPTNGKPVTSWRDRDSAFVDVALNIEKVALYYVQSRPVGQSDQPPPSSQPQSRSEDSSRASRTSTMDKCPFCSAETRPGDNFCLNCGNRLQPSTPSPQAAAPPLESMPGSAGWASPALPYESSWNNLDLPTIAQAATEVATMQPPGGAAMVPPAASIMRSQIEVPAYLIVRTTNNETVHEYVLDKPEMSIGRAPGSDILLSKDKLVSRRHATILYENGQYSICDERSVNGTFVNSQQLDESSARVLHNGDTIAIGEHELIFQTANTVSSGVDIESMPIMAVSPPSPPDLTYPTREDTNPSASAGDEYGSRSITDSEMPEPGVLPEEINRSSVQEETIAHAITELPDTHAQMISEAIRRAYYTESVAAYEHVLSRTPEDVEALRGLGKALYSLARYDEALDAFRRALLIREIPAAYAGLGDVLVKCKSYDEAVTAYEKALQLDPDVTLDYPHFIHALRAIGRADEADRIYASGRDLGYF